MSHEDDTGTGTRAATTWRIRRQRPDELAAVMTLGDAAFGEQERIGALVEALQADDAFTGESFVAVDRAPEPTDQPEQPEHERIIGHAMLTRCWLDTEERLLTIPVLSPLAVHPEYQGRGVAKALLAFAIGAADAAGEIGVVLEGDPAFYRRYGWEPAEPWGLLRPSPRIPQDAFQWVRLPAWEPWMRGRVVYPEVFWRFDAVGLRGWRGPAAHLEVTTVTIGARDLSGLARFYGDLLGHAVPPVPAGEDWVALRHDDAGVTIAVQHEPHQQRATWPAGPEDQHMQIHLEIRADDLERAVEHALSCGATLAEHQPQDDVRVMLDPEGHPFCLWTITV